MTEGRRVVFAGTPEFAAVVLAALQTGPETLVGVMTQPDRPAGRGRKLQASPVKVLAESWGVPLWQGARCRDLEAATWLQERAPDLLIVVAFGQILPQRLLDIPRLGAINVHASLLPAWRGAAPIARAIEAGDQETGICIMQMEAGLDSGPVLWTRRMAIDPDDTAASLHDRLAALGADSLRESLDRLWDGKLQAVAQDDARATYAKKLQKEEAQVDWGEDAQVLARKVRAFNPYPVAYTLFRGQNLRLWSVRFDPRQGPAGTLLAVDADGPVIACGDHSIKLLEVQPAGKGRMGGGDFARGQRLQVGEALA